jgi:hypothetical protein
MIYKQERPQSYIKVLIWIGDQNLRFKGSGQNKKKHDRMSTSEVFLV